MNASPDIPSLRDESLGRLQTISSLSALTEFEVEWLGRKGRLTSLLKSLSTLSLDEKKSVGSQMNAFKEELASAIDVKLKTLKGQALQTQLLTQTIDLSLPGVPYRRGHPHPLSLVMTELIDIFRGLGFVCADGPELESEFYNFEALNIAADHPARDMQDTFYIAQAQKQLALPHIGPSQGDSYLLRTHTSPVQVHIMQNYPPPIAIVVPGRVYRNEAMDATHSSVFHQMEGLLVDEGISFADLKGLLSRFAEKFFGAGIKTRFRPSYFPFTEPSAEMDISCLFCGGAGCRVCKNSGWIETLGAGMVNPAVFSAVNIDAEKYTGLAFGMGIERLALIKYGIDDLRLFYENDIRLLSQF